MSLERFCRKPVVTVQPQQTVRDVALKMRDQHVGAVVVVEDGRPVGILTDRDIVFRVIVENRDPGATPVREVMSRDPTVVRSGDKIDDAISSIRVAHVRRVPIVNAQGSVVGIVTLDDIVVLLAGELSAAAGSVQGNRGP
jgi:CBS domain-containing protein